jgi:hypothetical protein
MSLRETINKNPGLSTAVLLGMAAAAIALIVWQLRGGNDGATLGRMAYYTDDDGKTFFTDDVHRIAPFTRPNSSRESVRAHVYRCTTTSKPFVGWMEKYTPEAQQEINRFNADPKNRGRISPAYSADAGRLIKKLGDEKWYKWTYERLDRYCRFMCSSTGQLAEEISPPSE